MPLSTVFPSLPLSGQIAALGDEFAILGEFVLGEVIKSGHINTTFRASYRRPDGEVARYIFQRINDVVFPSPRDVMHNVEKVTRHIHWKMLRVRHNSSGQTLCLYPARGGRNYIDLPGSGVWRCYNCIEGTHTYDVAEHPRQAREAAFAFGSFLELVSDMNPEDIHETIPAFHDTRKRFDRLMAAVKRDVCGRAASCRGELDMVCSREADVDVIGDLLSSGAIPVRITHNDTKINNVMLSEKTDKAVCVIDLDTVMPGSLLYDFGDMVRTMTSPVEEDEVNLDLTLMRISMFQAVVQGYLAAVREIISPVELEYLAFSGKLITLETGIRFLTDYLEGDKYFRTERPGQNLDRARTQLKLVQEMENQFEEMKNVVRQEFIGFDPYAKNDNNNRK